MPFAQVKSHSHGLRLQLCNQTLLCGCLQVIAGFFHLFQHWLFASGALISEIRYNYTGIFHFYIKSVTRLDLSLLSWFTLTAFSPCCYQLLTCFSEEVQINQLNYSISACPRWTGACNTPSWWTYWSSWRVPQMLLETKNRIKRGIHTGLAFISGAETWRQMNVIWCSVCATLLRHSFLNRQDSV